MIEHKIDIRLVKLSYSNEEGGTTTTYRASVYTATLDCHSVGDTPQDALIRLGHYWRDQERYQKRQEILNG